MSGPGPGIVLKHIEVVRTARYAVAGGGPDTDEIWFVLHGYRQLAERFLARLLPLASERRLLVAPEALSRFYVDEPAGRHGPEHRVGATWMTREDRDAEIRDYVGYLDRLHDEVRAGKGGARVGVLGFSQGVHTAARWITLGAVRPERTVLWGAYLPHDLDAERARARLGDTRMVFVQGRADPFRREDLEREHEERVQGLGLEAETRWCEGGHELDDEVLEELIRLG